MGATAAFALSAVSTVGGFVQDQNAARAARQQGNYAASIYELNAEMAERQRVDALARGSEAEGRARAGTRQLAGRQRAAYGAQGIDPTTGSAAMIAGETAELGELDALTLRNNARREAWGFQMQGINDRLQAGLARQAGANEADAYGMRAMGTLLTGGLQTYGMAGDSARAIRRRTDVRPVHRGGWGGAA